jgi:hypothetical protein
MFLRYRYIFAALLAIILSFPAHAKALIVAMPSQPVQQTALADVVIIGKVIELEKDPVEAAPYAGAPKNQKVPYKIAVIKIEDSLLGGTGLTQLRVGFIENEGGRSFAPAPALQGGAVARIRPIGRGGVINLTVDQQGCFFLAQHPEADFYILSPNGMPLDKKAKNYDTSLAQVKKAAEAIEDPKKALQSKEKADREMAAVALLNHYRARPMRGRFVEEDIPAEESKLILEAIQELPWQNTSGDPNQPTRGAIWHYLQTERYGFKNPQIKAQAGVPLDANKIWEEATSKFLKENVDKVRIKKMVAK